MDAFAIGLLLVLVSKLTVGIGSVRDLPVDDEAHYEAVGVRLFAAWGPHPVYPRPGADWGPAYCGWYALLNLLCPDRVRLFDVSWSLLVAMIALASYAVSRKLGLAPVFALMVGAAPLATNFFHIQPFPNLFYLVVLLAACVVAQSCRDGRAAASVLIGAFGISSFVRPEATLVFIPCALVHFADAARTLRRGASLRATLGRATIAFAPFMALAWTFGNPLGSSRSFDAFSQHYAFIVTRREHLSQDPWLNFEPILQRDFGTASTVMQALVANPRAMLQHVIHNLSEVPGNVLDLVALRSSVTTAGSFRLQVVSTVLLALFFLALVAGFFRVRPWPRSFGVVVAFFSFACAAAAPGALVVFPRAHYLVAPCALGAVLAATWMFEVVGRVRVMPRSAPYIAPIAAAAVLWFLIPSSRASAPPAMPVRQTVEALRALRLREAPILELGPGFAAFAGYDYPTVSVWAKNEPLAPFLHRHDVGIVIARERYLVRGAFSEDPAMAEWLAEPERFGFCQVYASDFLRAFAKPSLLGEVDRRRFCRRGQ